MVPPPPLMGTIESPARPESWTGPMCSPRMPTPPVIGKLVKLPNARAMLPKASQERSGLIGNA